MTVNLSSFRVDFIPRHLTKVAKNDEGFLTGSAAVARVGVLKYRLADGSIRGELVPAETLFAQDSMDTLKLKPITNSHPPEQLLNASSVKQRHIGTTGEKISREDDFLVTSLVVMDGNSIKDAEKGRSQLSPGYRVELRLEKGEYKGDQYDAVQVKRTYNHLALVDIARGGEDLKLHLDGAGNNEGKDVRLDGFEIEENNEDKKDENNSTTNSKQRSSRMVKWNLDGIEYEAAPEVINHLKKVEKERADAQDALTTEKASHEKTKADLDTTKAKLDTAEKRDIKAEAQALAKARTSLERQATPHLDKDTVAKLDSMSDEDIRDAVTLKAFPGAKEQLAKATPEYKAARYDSALDVLSSGDGDAISRQRQSVKNDGAEGNREDAMDAVAARKRMIDDLTGASASKKE